LVQILRNKEKKEERGLSLAPGHQGVVVGLQPLTSIDFDRVVCLLSSSLIQSQKKKVSRLDLVTLLSRLGLNLAMKVGCKNIMNFEMQLKIALNR